MGYLQAGHSFHGLQQVFQGRRFAEEAALIVAQSIAGFRARQRKAPPVCPRPIDPHRIRRLANSGPTSPHVARWQASPKLVNRVDIFR